MPNRSPYDGDFLFAEQCLGGNDAALEELQGSRVSAVEGFLRSAGVPPPEAKVAVTELVTELLATDENQVPLLAQYHGQCALETWLNRAALSRAISRRRKEERYRRRLETAKSIGAFQSDQPTAPDEAEGLLREMLREAIQQALAECPGDDFVIVHLLFGSNLHASEVAKMFGCNWRTVKDRAEAACAQVRFSVQAGLQRRDPWLNLSWGEIVNLLMPDLPPLFEAAPPKDAASS